MGLKINNHKAEVLQELDEKIERALTTVGIEWQANSSILSPVVTGRLAASINYATKGGKGSPNNSMLQNGAEQKSNDYSPHGTPNKHSVVVGTNVEYAERIEEGGAKEPQHSHFLRRGFTNHTRQYKKILEEELK